MPGTLRLARPLRGEAAQVHGTLPCFLIETLATSLTFSLPWNASMQASLTG